MDPLLQAEAKAHRCIFITPHQIDRQALESAFHDIMEQERREISIVDGPILVGLIKRYLPNWFEQLASTGYSTQLIEALDVIPESRAFDLSRELRMREIYVDIAFAPALTLGSALTSGKILEPRPRQILCTLEDLDDLRQLPFWVDVDVITPLSPTDEAKHLEKKQNEIHHALSVAKEKHENRSIKFLEDQLKNFELFVVRSVNLVPMCRNLNRRIQTFRRGFERLRETNPSPKTITRVVRTGLQLGSEIRHLVQNRTLQYNWPQISAGFSCGSVDPSWQLPSTVLAAVDAPIVVFGPPGAGKTTLLRHMAIEQARSNRKPHPIFFLLNRIRAVSQDLLMTECKTQLAALGIKTSSQRMERQIRTGQYLLYLDGLDEVGANAAGLFQMLQDICRTSKRLRVVVSSREYHDYGDWPGAMFVRLAPFSDAQMLSFIEKWFRTAPSNRTKLRTWLENLPSMKEIARTPMVLTLLCSLVEAEAELPATEVGLYQKRFDLLLGKWEHAKGIPQMPEEMRARYWHFLMKLAFHTHKIKARIFSFSDAIDLTRELASPEDSDQPSGMVANCLRRGLIEPDPHGGFSFGHLTYQEFLAGSWLSHHNPIEWVAAYVSDPWWTKALQFYAATKQDLGQLLALINSDTKLAAEHFATIIKLLHLAPLTSKLQVNEFKLRYSPSLPRM